MLSNVASSTSRVRERRFVGESKEKFTFATLGGQEDPDIPLGLDRRIYQAKKLKKNPDSILLGIRPAGRMEAAIDCLLSANSHSPNASDKIPAVDHLSTVNLDAVCRVPAV